MAVTPHAQHQDVAVTITAASTSAATVEGIFLRAQAAAYQVRDYLTQGVCKIIWQKSIPAPIYHSILYYYQHKE
jgi:hypothetical protein